jgi:hypothetical protein
MVFDQAGNMYAPNGNATPAPFTAESLLKITPAGSASTFASSVGFSVAGLAIDASGDIFASIPAFDFSTAHSPPRIVKITPGGTQSTFVQGSIAPSAFLIGGPIALEANGNLLVGGTGMVTQYALDGTPSALVTSSTIKSTVAMALDAVGNLYVSDPNSNAVLQIVLVPSPLVAAVLPGSRSVPIGVPATVFATIVNFSGNQLKGCLSALPYTASSQLSLQYRPTNPATNAVIGVLDVPVTIRANGSQSFVLGFNANTPVTAQDQSLVFSCQGAGPAPTFVGVNALDRKIFINVLAEGRGDIGGAMLPPPAGVWGMPPDVLATIHQRP